MSSLTEDEIVDLEEFGRAGRPLPPSARRFRIRIDRTQYVVDVPEMTGRQLLELAGKTPPEQYALYQKSHGSSPVKVELDQVVDFRRPGIERFLVLPLDQTEGLVESRRQFQLPADDQRFLAECGLRWETVVELQSANSQPVQRVVFYGVPVPEGYNRRQVDLYFRIEGLYPDTHIDMAYVHPSLARVDGQPIANLADEAFDGRTWQRWSRHRTEANPWRPGVDNLETHFTLVPEWFRQEFQKR